MIDVLTEEETANETKSRLPWELLYADDLVLDATTREISWWTEEQVCWSKDIEGECREDKAYIKWSVEVV